MKDFISTIKKYNKILNLKQKINMIVLIIMMLFGALMETFSVSAMVPLVTALMDEDLLINNSVVKLIINIAGLKNSREFIIFILSVLIVVYIVKGLFNVIQEYSQARFITNGRVYIQKRLMTVYLDYPYEFFLNKSTAEIIKLISTDAQNCFALLDNIMVFFTELFVSSFLFIAVCIVDFYMALIISAIVLLELVIITGFMKKPMLKQGIEIRELSVDINKWLMQAVSGIKETKVSRKEDFFIRKFSEYSTMHSTVYQKNKALSALPKVILESVTIAGMLMTMILFMLNGKNPTLIIPQLSAFAVAAVRIIPSANRISTVMANIVYYSASIDSVTNTLNTLRDRKDENVHKKDVIECVKNKQNECIIMKDITYKYPGTDNLILDDASLEIPIGKSIGIIGTSGAGKTTVVDVLMGLLSPLEGQVLYNGYDIKEIYNYWLEKISYIPQMIFMMDDTIAANVAYGYNDEKINEELVWKVLEEANLKEYVESLPDSIYTQIGEKGIRLSGGQRQRIGIARALYSNPEIIILDEATSALDNETERVIMESINSLHGKKTLIIIAHRLTTIKECDLVYKVEGGKIKLCNE